MANSSSTDPYEQQLLAMFESCCSSQGDQSAHPSLDAKGLARLCEKLQLEEQAPRLLERLLSRQDQTQVTFPQFRDALLSLLGAHVDEIDASPEREVRPKFVYGKKKYGRRSRPEHSGSSGGSDSEGGGGDSSPEQTPPPPPCDGSGDVTPRKRKWTPASAPISDHGVRGKSLSEEEESVRATWERLGVAHEGYLGRDELRLVCKAAGLEGAADELVQRLFERLGVEQDGRVSFEQFLHLFRTGLGSTDDNSPRGGRPHSQQQQEQQRSLTFVGGDDDTGGKTLGGLSLDTCTSGLVSPEQLLALWEAGGVPDAARLLQDLGLGSPPLRAPINLADIAAALEEEARALVEEAGHPEQPLTCVLQASLVTQQAEIKCLKAALEQVLGERDKLRQDVAEANERAALLAQEVDDRHTRLEQVSQQQARLQEQRHGEEVRGLQAQLSAEREQLSALTTGLELRLGQMQAEEAKLRSDFMAATKRCESSEKENTSLRERLVECEQLKAQLQWKVETIPQLELRLSELEVEQSEMHTRTVLPLQEKLESLTAENTTLRDANDELTLKLEELQGFRHIGTKPSGDVDVPRNVGRRRGRRGGPSSDESSDEDSPRLGKLRRRAPTEGEEETEKLHQRVAELERQLALCHQQAADSEMKIDRREEHSEKPLLSLKQVNQSLRAQILQEVKDEYQTEMEQLRRCCEELTQSQKELGDSQSRELGHTHHGSNEQTMKSEFKMYEDQSRSDYHTEDTGLQQSLQRLQDELQKPGECTSNGGTDEESLDQVKAEIERILSAKIAIRKENFALRETISELAGGKIISEKGEEVQTLRNRVAELESSLELMREEYERCEDYWQGKLEEERRLYEQEQAAMDERFVDLEQKIGEYEQMLCQEQGSITANSSTITGRLSPIEESFVLEKQVTDLEDECLILQQQLAALTTQHNTLQRHLAEICHPERHDAAVQTEYRPRSVSLISGFSLRDKNTQVTQVSLEELEPLSQPRLMNGEVHKYHVQQQRSTPPREQSCRVQLTVMQALSARLQQQEQRSKRLEALLSQQQAHNERLMHQHRVEITALHTTLRSTQDQLHQHEQYCEEQAQKLVNSDLLVKELYVENAVLLATINTLEQRCAQYAQQAAPGSA